MIGRYVQSDSIGLNGGSLSTYDYVNGRPFESHDRFGLAAGMVGNVIQPTTIVINYQTVYQTVTKAVPYVSRATGVASAAYIGWGIGTWMYDNYGDYCQPGFDWLFDHIPGMYMGKDSKRSQKEKASDKPSWADCYPRDPREDCQSYAKRILNEKYGCDDPRAKQRGAGSEYSKIVKSCERGDR